ncbi:uncharacterized protein BCR38DRAFT_413923 [Pseudomassariella vexata]|uniref:Uncharacterized protein n=1 Tax=Pseudomassariella vexata TaxID=1141098 RepID=A0A1Y2DFR7_9PEZI|nr:uncharacterized protein BCR38DRAFT_413923 [Pseudomassariella vexata]ORY57535.1 hypothetical protein BCR38DRAFT_413923 [Pseudomassariella vexata]
MTMASKRIIKQPGTLKKVEGIPLTLPPTDLNQAQQVKVPPMKMGVVIPLRRDFHRPLPSRPDKTIGLETRETPLLERRRFKAEKHNWRVQHGLDVDGDDEEGDDDEGFGVEAEEQRLHRVMRLKRISDALRRDKIMNNIEDAPQFHVVAVNPFWRGLETDGPYYDWLNDVYYDGEMPEIVRRVNGLFPERGFPQLNDPYWNEESWKERDKYYKTEQGKAELDEYMPFVRDVRDPDSANEDAEVQKFYYESEDEDNMNESELAAKFGYRKAPAASNTNVLRKVNKPSKKSQAKGAQSTSNPGTVATVPSAVSETGDSAVPVPVPKTGNATAPDVDVLSPSVRKTSVFSPSRAMADMPNNANATTTKAPKQKTPSPMNQSRKRRNQDRKRKPGSDDDFNPDSDDGYGSEDKSQVKRAKRSHTVNVKPLSRFMRAQIVPNPTQRTGGPDSKGKGKGKGKSKVKKTHYKTASIDSNVSDTIVVKLAPDSSRSFDTGDKGSDEAGVKDETHTSHDDD